MMVCGAAKAQVEDEVYCRRSLQFIFSSTQVSSSFAHSISQIVILAETFAMQFQCHVLKK